MFSVIIDLEKVRQVSKHTSGQNKIKIIADHYGVFDHLFGDAYFYPRVPLDINFEKDDAVIPVRYGNIIKPAEATNKPSVKYESEDDALWTLILTNPDGHLSKENSEYVHWFV